MGLSWITVVWSAMAAGCITIGALYASAWFRQRTLTANIAFAVIAVMVGCIAMAELLLMRAQSPDARNRRAATADWIAVAGTCRM